MKTKKGVKNKYGIKHKLYMKLQKKHSKCWHPIDRDLAALPHICSHVAFADFCTAGEN